MPRRTGPNNQVLTKSHVSATRGGLPTALAVALAAVLPLGCAPGTAPPSGPATSASAGAPGAEAGPSLGPGGDTRPGVWISPEEVALLPRSGPAWDNVAAWATDDWGPPDPGDQESQHDVHVLAGALYAVRTGDPAAAQRVREALAAVTATFPAEVLPAARNLTSYVVAADLVGYRDPAFAAWVEVVIDQRATGRAGVDSLRASAMTDPSNHGAHARTAVLAAARYLGDEGLVLAVAERFHDWLGRSGRDFVWKDPAWQADPAAPVGINPAGAVLDGLTVDGVLPEEQRRSGAFTPDPPDEPYVWEALQGATATAEMLERAGYPAWEWQDQALRRAVAWQYDVNRFPAAGDDVWEIWLVNAAYGTTFAATSPAKPGKSLGFTDWTHAPNGAQAPASAGAGSPVAP